MDRIETLKNYLRDNPLDSFLQHAMALEYIKIGDDAAAKNLFEIILTRDAGYIGSYYHLAKLHERSGDMEAAIRVYQQGMEASKNAGDNHTFNELKSAFEDLAF